MYTHYIYILIKVVLKNKDQNFNSTTFEFET